MKITELTREQLDEVKVDFYSRRNGNISYGEIADIGSLVSDGEVFDEYSDVEFTEEDFCSR